ncbi:MAG: carbohydrate ABC transporter permease [Candidatus Promineifilaceae bacterium]
MSTTTTNVPSNNQHWESFNLTRIFAGIGLLAGTSYLLYLGFKFLQTPDVFLQDYINPTEQQLQLKIIITVFAIIWGVGGMSLLFYLLNWIAEGFPHAIQQYITPYIFVLPASALLIYTLGLPTIRTIRTSFFDRNAENFVGLANYQAVFTNRIMLTAFRNNVLWLVFGATFSVAIGLVVATLADRSKFEKLAKSLIFLPMAISFVGAGVIWNFIYVVRDEGSNQIGLLNALLVNAGFEPQAWTTTLWINKLVDNSSAIQAWQANLPEWMVEYGLLGGAHNFFLIIIFVWLQTGFAMVLFSAALKGIPSELLEAARVDGASEWTVFFRIMIPSIWGTIVTVTTTIVIASLKIFDIVRVMGRGQASTQVIATQFYQEINVTNNKGLAATIAVVLLVAVVPVMIYNLREFSKRETF